MALLSVVECLTFWEPDAGTLEGWTRGQLEQLQHGETPDDGISLLSMSKRVCTHLCGTCTLCRSAVLLVTAAFTQQVRLLHR